MLLEWDSVEVALERLGGVLEERGLAFEIVVIGGSALLLLNLIRRPTRDLDVLALVREGRYVSADPLPDGLRQAAVDVARTLGLADNWLNSGPTGQLKTGLPEGFERRVETRTYRTLVVHIASRFDQIHLKLYAAADYWPYEQRHVDDLRRLAPTRAELDQATEWALGQEANPAFRQQVDAVVEALGADGG